MAGPHDPERMPSRHPMKIPLTPGQAVTAHGWVRARCCLTWGDVLANEGLTFRFLLNTCRLPESQLFTLQPDLEAWVKADRATLEDAPHMAAWGAHPIRDFHADLAELIRMGWPPETFKRLGVTVDDMAGVGLSPDTMMLFGFTLHGWATLGLSRAFAERIPVHTLFRLFKMPRMDVLASLR